MYGSAGAPVPRWDPDQYRTSDLDVRQWIWDELCSDGQKKPDASVWKHLLELQGTGHAQGVAESGQAVFGYLAESLRGSASSFVQSWREQIMRVAWRGSCYRTGCMMSGSMPAKTKAWMAMGVRVLQHRMAYGELALTYRTRTMKMCAADESYMQWPYPCRSTHAPRCKQRKARIRMHVGFCVLYLGLCTRGLRHMVDAPCVRVDRASGQCCDVSGWRSAVQQKTSSFLQCLSRQCLFSICVWRFVRLTYHAAVFFVRIASLHIPAPMRLCLRHVLDAAECLRKVASCLSHVSQALSLHVQLFHCQCVSRSGPNSGRGSSRCQGYKFLFHPVLLLLITLCIVPAASGVKVAAPPMGVAEAALDKASKKCDAAKQHGYQNNPGTSAMSRSVKRAHRRACARASKQGGTWYRGKWCTFRSLGGDLIQSNGRCNGKGRSRVSIKPRASQSRFEVLTWNCGGLSVGQLDELLCHLADARPNVAVVCLQETLWRRSNEWLTDEWICVHDHDPQHRHASAVYL